MPSALAEWFSAFLIVIFFGIKAIFWQQLICICHFLTFILRITGIYIYIYIDALLCTVT